jgi:HPt (histidine-containing phosphotransfer) domain-containing protein
MNTLNWDKKFALEQAADDTELLQELLEIFKGSYKADLHLIKDGIQKGDTKQVYSASHSIKGAAASLGIDGIREIAMGIEVDSRNGSLVVAKGKVQALEDMLLQLEEI